MQCSVARRVLVHRVLVLVTVVGKWGWMVPESQLLRGARAAAAPVGHFPTRLSTRPLLSTDIAHGF